jgi:hypothetical protein
MSAVTRISTTFRRFALALATAQAVAFAAAPVVDAIAHRQHEAGSQQQIRSPERPSTHPDGGNCPACQLVNTHAPRPDAARLALPSANAAAGVAYADAAVPDQAPLKGLHSRAPPTLLV